MESDLVQIPIPESHRKDPAWNHVHMFKHEDRVQLRCIYCSKLFKGGGINRIKQHLAKQKGDAAVCERVPPNVQDQMKQKLSGSVTKRRRKDKIVEDLANVNQVPSEVDVGLFEKEFVVNAEVQSVGTPNVPQLGPDLFVNGQGTYSAMGVSRKKGKERSIRATADDAALRSSGFGAKTVNNNLHMAVGRFLFDIGAPVDAVDSVYFKPMVDALVSVGLESVMPSPNDIRGWILKKSVEEVRTDVNKLASAWEKTGCSILINQEKTETKILLNILIYSPEGTCFLKSVDASGFSSSSGDFHELLKQVVEEVGAKNVLQVITDNEEISFVAARRLADTFPNLYWTPCAVSSVDMIFRDFAKVDWINSVLERAKSITRFVYNHSTVLNIMRRHTSGNDIVEPALTHSATNFTTLKRIIALKHNLQSMITSQEWMESRYLKEPGGLEMLDIMNDELFWSSGALITRLTNPLLRVLRIAGSQKRPAMGYIYAGMYRVKETIKRELVKEEDYMIYWEIIDHWWQQQWQHPLYAAGFYLNPKFFYSFEGGNLPNEVVSGMFDSIERLVPDIMVQDKIIKEMNLYKDATGNFARPMAIRARDTLLPAEWWSTYGGTCPNLARFAIRVLSQTCSSLGLSPNHTPITQFHDVKNCLEHQRLRDLVFVQYNSRLKQIRSKEQKESATDPTSVDAIGVVDDWLCENNVSLLDCSGSDWMALDSPAVNAMLLEPPGDDIAELGSGFDDYEVLKIVKNVE